MRKANAIVLQSTNDHGILITFSKEYWIYLCHLDQINLYFIYSHLTKLFECSMKKRKLVFLFIPNFLYTFKYEMSREVAKRLTNLVTNNRITFVMIFGQNSSKPQSKIILVQYSPNITVGAD